MGETLSEPVFDRNATLARVEGDIELLSEVVELFFDDYPGMLSEIRESIGRCDGKTLERAAHGLKGAVGNFSARYAFDAALRLEAMGRGGDFANADQACSELEKEITRLQRALAMFRRELVA